MDKPTTVTIKVTRQELHTMVNDHLNHGKENSELAHMVAEEGIDGNDLHQLAMERYNRANQLLKLALTLDYCDHVLTDK